MAGDAQIRKRVTRGRVARRKRIGGKFQGLQWIGSLRCRPQILAQASFVLPDIMPDRNIEVLSCGWRRIEHTGRIEGLEITWEVPGKPASPPCGSVAICIVTSFRAPLGRIGAIEANRHVIGCDACATDRIGHRRVIADDVVDHTTDVMAHLRGQRLNIHTGLASFEGGALYDAAIATDFHGAMNVLGVHLRVFGALKAILRNRHFKLGLEIRWVAGIRLDLQGEETGQPGCQRTLIARNAGHDISGLQPVGIRKPG